MAISIAHLTGGITTGSGSTTTASISPASNSRVLVTIVWAVAGGGDFSDQVWDDPVSGAGLTWTEVDREFYGTRRQMVVMEGTAASPTPGALTISLVNMSSGTLVETHYSVDEITGHDNTTPFGTSATTTGTGTSASVTVVGTPDAGDFVFAAFAQTAAASDMTINSELSNELAETTGGSDVRRLLTAYSSAPDGTPTPGVTWTGTEDYTGIAFIVNVGAGGPTSTQHLKFNLLGVG